MAELGERARRLEEEGSSETARMWGETAAQIALHKEALSHALDETRDAQNTLAEARTRYDAQKLDLQDREAKLKDLRTETEALREALGEAERALHTRDDGARAFARIGRGEIPRASFLERVVGDYHLRVAPDDRALRAHPRARLSHRSHGLGES